MSAEYKCPCCGNSRFYIDVMKWADVVFKPDDEHEVADEGGDVEWTDESTCACYHCNHKGILSQFKVKE